MIFTGAAAIQYAETNGLTLNKYNDPIEEAREGLTPAEARKVAADDPSLIWLETEREFIVTCDAGARPHYNKLQVTRRATSAKAALELELGSRLIVTVEPDGTATATDPENGDYWLAEAALE